MNLRQNPTVEQLQAIIRGCNDKERHHVVWVGRDGEVHAEPFQDVPPPVVLEEQRPTMRFRLPVYGMGNGYVGPEAAKDEDQMEELFDDLVKAWEGGVTGLVEGDL